MSAFGCNKGGFEGRCCAHAWGQRKAHPLPVIRTNAPLLDRAVALEAHIASGKLLGLDFFLAVGRCSGHGRCWRLGHARWHRGLDAIVSDNRGCVAQRQAGYSGETARMQRPGRHMARPPLKSATAKRHPACCRGHSSKASAADQRHSRNSAADQRPISDQLYRSESNGGAGVQEKRPHQTHHDPTFGGHGVAHLYRSFIAILCRSFPVAIAPFHDASLIF